VWENNKFLWEGGGGGEEEEKEDFLFVTITGQTVGFPNKVHCAQ
jgi:hypothetical protein